MTHTLTAVAAILCYSAAAVLIGMRLFRTSPGWMPPRQLTLGLILGGLLLHSWLLWNSIFSHAGLNLGFYNALALTTWTVITLLFVSSLTKPVENLGLVLLPAAALSLIFEAALGNVDFMRPNADWPLKIHVLLSMLAYSLLTLAAVQAILLAIQDHQLRSRHPGGFVRTLPPLQTMESLLFEMITAGFVLLTLALLSGFAFLENMLAQHLVHKTVLSLLAWLMFGGLLLGRFRRGWRGRTAIVWTLGGFAVLILAYFGSKAVLELILQRV
ncbi:cytochrome C biogenesis protein [Thiocapsa imhoffii]|uniref:Cytochrome C biogenesis protein n=1 Tax=Thiocapsa imhoffii TaxID=382777 RepID=A0A9X0WHS1_9GAMM|nr:cytochrome c biogenesis protein CcsA [Thiocapsa imhoffii]MBK1644347.1 cytochrome C biogenesis protein [Thiocapsa imhoffii]